MSQAAISPKTFTAGEALEAFRRVKLSTGSGTQVEYADQSDSNNYIGVTLEKVASGKHVAVALKGNYRTFKVVASEALSAGAELYAADDGKVSDTVSGNAIGTALEAATADGDIIEAVLNPTAVSAVGAASILNYAAADGGVPFVIKASCTAEGAEDESVIASFPRKALVIRAWMISRDTNAANVTLKNAGDAFTSATAKGTDDDAVVEFDIIAEYDEIAAEAAVVATFSAAASVDVFLLCVPIA